MKRRMRHTCSDISAFCWKLCKGQDYVCIRLWTTPQPHSTQRPTLAPAKIKGSFASARSGSHRYVCNKRARCTRKAFSKVPKCLKHIKLNCGSILYFIWLASEMHGVSLIVLIVAHAQKAPSTRRKCQRNCLSAGRSCTKTKGSSSKGTGPTLRELRGVAAR